MALANPQFESRLNAEFAACEAILAARQLCNPPAHETATGGVRPATDGVQGASDPHGFFSLTGQPLRYCVLYILRRDRSRGELRSPVFGLHSALEFAALHRRAGFDTRICKL